MDPLSALSIAAAVVQFVEFGSNIVKGAHDAYKSASNPTTKDYNVVIDSHDLSRLVENIESKLNEGHSTRGETYPRTRDIESSEDIFRRLCNDCEEVASSLEHIFSKIRPQGKSKLTLAASSLASELKKVVKAGEIEKLADRLSLVRQQVMMTVLTLLLYVLH